MTHDLDARFALAQDDRPHCRRDRLDYFHRRETLVIETKRDAQDVVSIADRQVETLIRDAVADAHPDDGFLGEEYGLLPAVRLYLGGRSIDGTSPFVNGMPSWCVSIAVLFEDKPVIGVIMHPASMNSMLQPPAVARFSTARPCSSTPRAPFATP